MNGVFYAVGTGPGDPELLTLKAAKILASADVIAGPGVENEPGTALRIAEAAVPEIRGKEYMLIPFPMTKDPDKTAAVHNDAAEKLTEILRSGRNIAFVTLGDPMIYSSAGYLLSRILEKGFRVEIVSGVPSFCAAAAKLQVPIALQDERILITPDDDIDLSGSDTLILMKAGGKLKALKEQLRASGRYAAMVENCGMQDEKKYHGVDEIPDKAGYFSLVIAKTAPAVPPAPTREHPDTPEP